MTKKELSAPGAGRNPATTRHAADAASSTTALFSLSSFMVLNVNGGDRVSYTYDEIDADTGEAAAQGSATLKGARFALRYYAGWFDTWIAGTAPAPTSLPTASPTPSPTAAPEATPTPAPTPSFPPGMDDVIFPDDEQEKAVRAILGTHKDKAVKLNELAAVTELSIVGHMFAADIGHTAFSHGGDCLVYGSKVTEGKVKDLSVIGRMAYLEKLALVYQPLSDVKALNGLVMLNELYLSGDRALISLTGLAYLPRLETLHLEHSGVRDLSPLADLPSLKTVTVSADMLPLLWPEGSAFTVILVP